MNHLENLIRQYYAWQGYIVRTNILVGRRENGGYECELDIVAYRHEPAHLVHLEPSLDAHTWDKREIRFQKKFMAGERYIKTTVFPWLHDSAVPIEKVAILVASPSNHATVGGGLVVNLDSLVGEICKAVRGYGLVSQNAIPEQYDLLRTIQLVECGYHRPPPKD